MSEDERTRSLASFAGTFTLDARGEFVVPGQYAGGLENAHTELLRLDGVLFAFTEDPSDGYRSMLAGARPIMEAEIPPGSLSSFAPRVVTIHHFGGDNHNVIVGVDERIGLALFEIGEIDLDDYYPSFVASWTPEGASSAYLGGAT